MYIHAHYYRVLIKSLQSIYIHIMLFQYASVHNGHVGYVQCNIPGSTHKWQCILKSYTCTCTCTCTCTVRLSMKFKPHEIKALYSMSWATKYWVDSFLGSLKSSYNTGLVRLTGCLGAFFWTVNSVREVMESSSLYLPRRLFWNWVTDNGSFRTLIRLNQHGTTWKFSRFFLHS